MGKVFEKMEAAEKSGQPIDKFLGDKGFVGIEDKFALQTMYTYRSYLDRFLQEGRNAPTPDQAEADIDNKFRTDMGLRTNVGQAKLDEAKMHDAMALQHSKPLELEAERRLQLKGEGSDSGYAGSVDWIRGSLTSAGGMLLPQGMTSQQLGHKIRLEHEMFATAKEQGHRHPRSAADQFADRRLLRELSGLPDDGPDGTILLPGDGDRRPRESGRRRVRGDRPGPTARRQYDGCGQEHSRACGVQDEAPAGPAHRPASPPAPGRRRPETMTPEIIAKVIKFSI